MSLKGDMANVNEPEPLICALSFPPEDMSTLSVVPSETIRRAFNIIAIPVLEIVSISFIDAVSANCTNFTMSSLEAPGVSELATVFITYVTSLPSSRFNVALTARKSILPFTVASRSINALPYTSLPLARLESIICIFSAFAERLIRGDTMSFTSTVPLSTSGFSFLPVIV